MINRIKYILLFGILIGFMACGDDSSTGPDPGEAPSLPEVRSEEAQPDYSFFENNDPQTNGMAANENYSEARNWALTNSGTFAIAGAYSGFLLAANSDGATFEDGVWVWEYSYQFENESFTIRLTAEEVPAGYEWAMYWSYDDGETSIEDYKVMEGTVSQDGSEGDWTFNMLDPDTNEEQVAYTSEWTVASDTESSMMVEWFNNSGTNVLTADYDKNEPEHTITFTYPNDPNITLHWNTDTNEGYFEQGGDRKCWDENFANDPSCS